MCAFVGTNNKYYSIKMHGMNIKIKKNSSADYRHFSKIANEVHLSYKYVGVGGGSTVERIDIIGL